MRIRGTIAATAAVAMTAMSSLAGWARYDRQVNLLRNASFEQHAKGVPAEWRWSPGRAKAELRVDTETSHNGSCALLLRNTARREPHVYSSVAQDTEVRPNTTYTLSCYVRTEDGGTAWIGGGAKWQHRFPFPKKTDGWQRVAGTFTTAAGESRFTLRILTESPTPGLWVDDVQLEEGKEATPFVFEEPLAPGQCRLQVVGFDPSPNLIPNPSFEVVHGARPQHWMWDPRNTDATMAVETGAAHTGSNSLLFTNGTRFGPHVYGWFGGVAGIPVRPGTAYTISASVRSEDPGIAWFGGGKGWYARCRVPKTNGKWERIAYTFTTKEDETTFPVMVVTESPTPGFRIDDMCLNEGPEPSPFASEGTARQATIDLRARTPLKVFHKGSPVRTRWAESKYPARTHVFCATRADFDGLAYAPEADGASRVVLRFTGETGEVLAETTQAAPTGKPCLSLAAAINVGESPNTRLTARAELWVNQTLAAECEREMRVTTARGIRDRLAEVRALRTRLASQEEKLQVRGHGDYSRLVLTVVDNFLPWIEDDLGNDRPDRAWDAAEDLAGLTAEAVADAEAVLSGKRKGATVPRYETSRLSVRGPSFVGTRRFPDGTRREGPVFFTGYGHFSQVRRDIERFPGYGCNLCQIEFGPRSVFPSEGQRSEKAIDDFLAVCDRAERSGVSVNLLLSPHYFPEWALEKWPHLRDCAGGFFKYCVHAPEARKIIEDSLRHVVGRIHKHPALHSLCLSNEPINVDLTRCRYTAEAWREWLRQQHGTIEHLNRRWGVELASFADVDVPPPEFKPGAVIYDFVRFNQQQFAAFHGWMADVIHEAAPEVPVHAKIMMGAHFSRQLHGVWSVSPELFSELSEINGNDCSCMPHRSGDWANGWLRHQMAYDFQRSMADKPVFNSENHLIRDRDHDAVPGDHVYASLWQGAVHGQSATTIWVWERTTSFTSSTAGSILHRPSCVAAAGRACLDQNRLAEPMTALQDLRPRIVLFWSLASVVQGETHAAALNSAYRAANFLGVPLGFVTERQLERYAAGGDVPLPLREARAIVVPAVTHLPAASLAGLRRFAEDRRGHVLRLGECFVGDEYGRARATVADVGIRSTADPSDEETLLRDLAQRSAEWGVVPAVKAVDSQGRQAWGVETRTAATAGGLVVNVCNHLREPMRVSLLREGKPTGGVDLITGEGLGASFEAKPLRPLLVAIGAKP